MVLQGCVTVRRVVRESVRMTVAPDRQRGCLATIAVFVVMLGIVGSGFVALGAVADVPTPPVTVADGVVIDPLPDWEFAGRSDDGRGILLSKGGGSLAVLVEPEAEDPAAAITALFAEWRAEAGTQITTGAIEASDVRPGSRAATATYAGYFAGIAYGVDGEVTAVAGSSTTVIFDGWADEGDFALVRPEVNEMIRGATIP
jgi:hypothetical protein